MAGSVELEKSNGNLGSVGEAEDGIAAFVLTGVASGAIVLGEVLGAFYSLDDVEAIGIDEAYDTANEILVWQQLKEFYDSAAEGTEMYLMLVSEAVTMTEMLDVNNDYAAKLLASPDVNGRVRLLGVGRVPDALYAPTLVNGLDDDIATALVKGQALAEYSFSKYRPISIFLEGRNFTGTAGDLLNYHDPNNGSYNRCHIWVGADNDVSTAKAYAAKYANVGFIVGWISNSQVQRSPGRVRRGATPIINAGWSDGTAFSSQSETSRNAIDGKGYMFFWKHFGKTGFYVNDGYAAVPLTDDYAYVDRGRPIDKAARIAYLTYLEEVQEDFDVDESGKMAAGVIKNLQQSIETAIGLQMIETPDVKEVSSVEGLIDPDQNVLSTNNIEVELAIIPKGKAKTIKIKLGFTNPQLA
ncbi:MAG: hypothetical protein CL843_16415 [Crocinitomicaceae bacterium]|nr:hypothetical protein [Crocinitomicaceae bacterium]|tara:strand:+ start:2840 stop:4075 length:1236 start_codon:yes stop_codon:yes gene_type:complete